MRTAINNVLAGIGPPLNVTDRIYSYPAEINGGTSVTTGSTAWQFGSWVNIVPGAWMVNSDFSLIGFTVRSSTALSGSWGGLKVQFGVGEVGGETVIGSSTVVGMTLSTTNIVASMPVSFLNKIPAGSNVHVRLASDQAGKGFLIKLIFCTRLYEGGIFLNSYVDGTDTAFTAQCVAGSGAWTYGTYVQMVQQNSINRDYYVRGISYHDTSATIAELVFTFATGAAGSETEVASIATMEHYNATYKTIYRVPLSTALKIPANSRLAVKLAARNGGKTVRVSADLARGAFYG